MKGVSQVATSALLIAVAITAVGIYSNWLPEFARESVQGITDAQDQQIRCDNAGLSLSEVVYVEEDSETVVTVTNSGTVNFRENVTIAAVNNSIIIGEEYLTELEVGNDREVTFITQSKPDYVLASSYSCPEVSSRRDRIQVQ